MVKKRRQGDPYSKESDSSSEENFNAEKNRSDQKCSHVKKAVDLQRLRRQFKKSSIENEKCVECAKLPDSDNPAAGNNEFEYDRTLWMCLNCGTNLCGRSVNKHALLHYNKPRSDSHALTLNTTTLEVWCYDCDTNIENVEGILKQTIDLINSELAKSKNLPAKIENGFGESPVINENSASEPAANSQPNTEAMRTLLGKTLNIVHSLSSNTVGSADGSGFIAETLKNLPRVRGLSNLGNTCFFNAVMQCLTQTPYLLDVLKELAEPKEAEFYLPGGKFTAENNGKSEEIDLEPISGKLKSWGPFTATLAESLEDLKKSGGVYNPRKLFMALTKIWQQFAGGDQHDSHELLRHLLESVKTEDLKRYQRIILSFLNYDDYRGKDLQSVPNDIKKKCKFYGQQAMERILCPEPVFRGFLVSTLTCQDCNNTSSRHENFLDLSLPVCTEKPAPPIRRKHDESPRKTTPKPKANKQHDKNRSSSSREQSDADVEDNLTEDVILKKSYEPIIDSNGNIEENVSYDKAENGGQMNSILELGISAEGSKALVRQISESSAADAANPSTDLLDSFQLMGLDEKQSARKRLNSQTDWSSTIAPRYQCEDGECSVQSCLNNFTGVELMTGNNKVGCDACSERINGKGGKTINTNATKQFLISSPPAVLILHLKRFQVGPRCMFRKITKHVSFPLLLDLAPFCASKVKTLPNVHRYQKKLMYSLYGIVEHSGSLYGGHYVAYVKVRPNLSADDPRWKFLPKGSKVELDQTDEQKVRLEEALHKTRMENNRLKAGDSDDSTSSESGDDITNEAPPMPATPPGKWYYVSDSCVQETTEEHVQKAQAYLLFYERIY